MVLAWGCGLHRCPADPGELQPELQLPEPGRQHRPVRAGLPLGARDGPGAEMQDAMSARRMAAHGATACAPSLSWPVHSTRCRSHTWRTCRALVRRVRVRQDPAAAWQRADERQLVPAVVAACALQDREARQ